MFITFWEREAGVRATLSQNPGKLWDAKADGVLPLAGNWSKTGVDPIFDHSWKIPYPGVAQLVARLLWEDTPGQSHNFISGCCAVGSAPALGAGGPGFESPHSDQILQKNRLFRRFFCVLSLVFAVLVIAVLWRFKERNSGQGMSERSGWNRQIPNPSLTGKLPHFLRFYRCRCRPLLIVCLRCVGREAGFFLL